MKSPAFLFLTLSFLMLPFFSMASDTDGAKEITGKVVSSEMGTPIEYVTISLFNKKDSTLITGNISDEEGVFTLSKIAYGSYYLELSFIGFKNKTISDLQISKDHPFHDLGTIQLTTASTTLEEVSVTAKKSAVSTNIDKQIVNVSSNLTASGGTAVDALKTAPSVTVDSEGNVQLRGSTEFTVLINGKPTAMTSSEVLKQTPADIIDKIEVVTSPSVKYSAEGTAGIINIILKKGANLGFNGLVNLTVGSKDKYNGNISLNVNRKKVRISTGLEWKDFTKRADNYYYRDLFYGDTTHHAYMGQDRRMVNKSLGFRFNIDYTPNTKHNFAYSMNTGYTQMIGDIKVNTLGRTFPESSELYRRNSFYFDTKPVYFTNNLSYSPTLEGEQTFTINTYYSFIDYNIFSSQKFALADSDYNIIDDQPYLKDVLNKNFSNDIRVDLDYTRPVNDNIKLETGVSVHNYNRFLNVTYDEFDYTSDSWQHNPLYTNKYDFDETIYGAYANFETEFSGIKASVGLRVEYMDRELRQRTTEEGYVYDKFNFFPGLSLSKSLNNQQSLKLALTNRINRPDEYMMNPFPEFEDDYFYAEGNPYLVPELSRALELSYQKIGEKVVFSTNLYYRKTIDKIDQKLSIGAEDKIHTIFHNDVTDESTGIELMGKSDLTDWWSMNANTNFYNYKIKGNLDDDTFSRKAFSWNAQLINSFSIGKSSSLQVISYYNSPTVRSQGELGSFYFVDIAFKQQFFNDRFSLNFQIKDVLQSSNYELKTALGNMELEAFFNNESPIFILTAGYQISKYKKLTKDVQTEFDM
jgi:outer membrane cobalamin receptor